LALGKWLGWVILDPIIGIVGGIVILRWAIALCKETTWVLLDAQDSTDLMDAITECVTKEGETWIVDLHIWDLGLGRRACVLSVVSLNPMTPDEYKAQLAELASFFHINVEVFAYSDSDPKYRLSFPEQGDSHDHGHSHYQEDGD
jgi:Co/Zn/Cd efflux system component